VRATRLGENNRFSLAHNMQTQNGKATPTNIQFKLVDSSIHKNYIQSKPKQAIHFQILEKSLASFTCETM